MADNKSIQKVFGLSDYRKLQLASKIPERTREAYREYGYFGGKIGGSSAIGRIDYSNDTSTASIRGPLSSATSYLAATGNTNFGYFGGSLPLSSKVDRIDYSNDSTTASTRGSLSLARGVLAATGNSNFGYFGGGRYILSPDTNTSLVDRINYSNDLATALVRGSFVFAGRLSGGTSNNNYGWYSGKTSQTSSSATSTVERINFSNDNINALVRGNNSNIAFRGATGNSNFGYFGGGLSNNSTVDRIDYANDTSTTSNRGPLSLARDILTATGNSNFGYFGGGYNSTLSQRHLSIIDRIDYSNDTLTALVRGPLFDNLGRGVAATSSHNFGGTPNSSFASNFTFPTVPNAGYFGGGTDGTNKLATIDKVDYANDTATASVRSALSSVRYALSATGNGSFGYFAGGRPAPAVPDTSTIDRIEYASDTQNAAVRSTLNNAVRLLASAGNSNFGYFSGGFPTRNGVDRLDYSTDTTATSPRQGLPLATYSLAATGNRNFGYFCGGLTASPTTNRSEIYRVDYSNDLTIPQNRGPLSEAKRDGTATGNDSFGYFGGAQNPGLSPSYRSQIERIDYSNDTVITSVRSRLNTPLFATGATGNSNFGYFGAGTNGPANFSTTDRINYSNDTAVASIRGPLSTAKSSLAATSPLGYGGAPIYFTNPLPEVLQKQIEFNDSNTLDLPFKRVLGSFGYFGGFGNLIVSNSFFSSIERINYSNDLTSPLLRGYLTIAKASLSGVGNKNYGWYGVGGRVYAFKYSTIDRIDYSNDNVVCSFRTGMSPPYYEQGSVTNDYYGWWFGGSDGAVSVVQRINYASDTSTPSNRGVLNQGSNCISGTSSDNYGWASGGGIGGGGFGGDGPYLSNIERINFSNDSVRQLKRGNLNIPRCASGSFGNQNYGWIFSGRNGISSSTSTIERIDYSNDLTNILIRSNVSISRTGGTSTGNVNYAWFSGGSLHSYTSSPTYNRIDILDFSNDLENSSIRSPLTTPRTAAYSSTNARNS